MPKANLAMPAETMKGNTSPLTRHTNDALLPEVLSSVSGLLLALFMWGHMFLVGSILFGPRGFDLLAGTLEKYFVAQPTILIISTVFVIHAAFAMRKIPAQLEERKAMFALARRLRSSPADWPGVEPGDPRLRPHLESWLWIWQVRTGMVMLVLGSLHLLLIATDIFTPWFGHMTGIEAGTSMARVQGGLWLPYAVLLLCVEFHAGVGLYRLAIKWGSGARLSRRTLWHIEKLIFWVFLGLGIWILMVLATWLSPPFEFVWR